MESVPVTTGAPSYTSVAHFARGNALSLPDVLMQNVMLRLSAANQKHLCVSKGAEPDYSLSYTNVADVFLPAAFVPLMVSVRDLPSGAITMVPL